MKSGNYTFKNRVKLVTGGSEYFSLLKELIGKANKCIHLQFYIFSEDETGLSVTTALKKAAAKGIDVFLQVDGYASKELSKKFVDDLKESGIRFKWFEPLFRSRKFYFGRRMHHKVVVVDGLYSLVGGRNVADKYNDLNGKTAWMDVAVYCEGEASFALYRVCRKMWGSRGIPDKVPGKDIETFCNKIEKKDYHSVRISRNDWVKRKNEIWKSYLYMFRHAEERITIMCSYFMPGRSLRKALIRAAKRGVIIKVILAGPSDVMMAKYAERFLYRLLLKYNIHIYEYQETILHAKIATYDDRWVTAGSYNVNNISAYASLELNFDIRNRPFAQITEEKLEFISKSHCKAITNENFNSSTGIFKKFWQWFCYFFINSMLNLFTFYFKQEE
ncbi:MAG TPA: phospholipase D-like domain-containing protein [Chitinophagaceae bacterium]|nr:phospholipase D-like domain-containing protein [Chitinophagaceae bacterium]